MSTRLVEQYSANFVFIFLVKFYSEQPVFVHDLFINHPAPALDGPEPRWWRVKGLAVYKEIGHTVDTVTRLQFVLDGMRLVKNFSPT